MTGLLERTHYCNELSEQHVGVQVSLYGWVHRRRDHGGVIFIDLRDRTGIVQLLVHPEDAALFTQTQSLRSEYVVSVLGQVQHRPASTQNQQLMTGTIEVMVEKLHILNVAKALPFRLDDYQVLTEEVRLKYRFLELRRGDVFKRFQMRAQILTQVRAFLEKKQFIEVETPILTRSTPEGARDYLVPSRTQPGHCFALPQSPQLFKQLLMAAGFDRYYQIAKCFRDEDLRLDRQPEFTQIDLEVSFLSQEKIMAIAEELLIEVFQTVLGVVLPQPFPRMTYAHAMQTYGSDKPDLSNPLFLVNVETCWPLSMGQESTDVPQTAAALRLPGGAALSRKQVQNEVDWVKQQGLSGLSSIKVLECNAGRAGIQSSALQWLSDPQLQLLLARTGAQDGDLIFVGSGPAHKLWPIMGQLRIRLGHSQSLKRPGWWPLWVTDFPLLEWDETGQRWVACHHPFTAPKGPLTAQAPGELLAQAYDLVLNGYEIGGGSIRNHELSQQLQLFELLGIDQGSAYAEFPHLLEALACGCPPHGGLAFGLDRLAMLMSGAGAIREVIAFPKTQSAQCPLTGAPAQTPSSALKLLHLDWIKSVQKDQSHNGRA